MHSSQLIFEIEPQGDTWTVSFCHEPNGTFRRRVDAMRAAVGDADRIHRLGHVVTVLVDRPAPCRDRLPKRILHARLS